MNTAVLLVAGLGRCGTTMMMTMLDAGGFPVTGPRPSYELTERFSPTRADKPWLAAQGGNAVKLLDPTRYGLRESDFTTPPVVILMERRASQQARSQVKLLNSTSNQVLIPRAAEKLMRRSIERDTPRLRAQMGHLGFVYRLQFETVLADPASVAIRLARIVHHHFKRGFDHLTAADAVLPRDPKCLPDLWMENAVLPSIAHELDRRGVA